MRRHRDRLGLTLVEVLATLALIVIVSTALMEISLGSLRVFALTRAEADQRSEAELVFERVMPSLRVALAVNQVTPSLVDVTQPLRDGSGNLFLGYSGLQPGNRVHFYRGDSLGVPSNNGQYLWQRINNTLATEPLAGGFTDCTFESLSVNAVIRGVRMTLVYQSPVLGTQTVTRTFSQEATCRNLF